MSSDAPHSPRRPARGDHGPDATGAPGSEVPELTDEELEFLNSLFDLARNGQTDELISVIDQGVPVNLANHKGDTLLILAIYNGHPDLGAALLQAGADPNRVNNRGQTALACAVFVQDEPSVHRLLEAGADPDAGAQSARLSVEVFGLDAMRALLPPRRA